MYRNILKILGQDKIVAYSSAKHLNNVVYYTTARTFPHLRQERKIISFSGWLMLVIYFNQGSHYTDILFLRVFL